jgi:acetyl-CoA carboxylase carboxyltransferase component
VNEEREMNASKEVATREDLEKFQQEIVHEFHVVSEGLIDQIKLSAEWHAGIVRRLDRMEKENNRQHSLTRAFSRRFP